MRESGSPIAAAMVLASYPPAYTGAGAQAAKLAERLVLDGVQIDVLCPDAVGQQAPRYEQRGGLRVRRFRKPKADARELAFGAQAAWWLAVHSRWQVLHLHGFNYWSLLPCLVAWAKGRPVLVKTTLLGPGADGALAGRLTLAQRLIAAFYHRVDAIVALSDALEESFRSAPGYRGRIVRIPNGVDTELFHPAQWDERDAARRRFELPTDRTVVVTVGRLEARKNVVALVEAAGVVTAGPLCLVLIGPPSPVAEDRANLERAIAALPSSVELRLLGELAPAELPVALRAADILVLPSRAEGMPNSLLEGMASGLGCIATDIPGSRDVLAKGGGVLVPLDDQPALAAQLDAWIAEPAAVVRSGALARRMIEEHYSIASVARQYVALYRTLIGED